MQRLEVSGALRPLYGSLGVEGLNRTTNFQFHNLYHVPHSSCKYVFCLVSTALLVSLATNSCCSYTCIYKLLDAGFKYCCI